MPSEIRNMIYRHAIIEGKGIELTLSFRRLGLLFTCSQIRSGSRPLWYFGNTFHARFMDGDTSVLRAFVRIVLKVEIHTTYKFSYHNHPPGRRLVVGESQSSLPGSPRWNGVHPPYGGRTILEVIHAKTSMPQSGVRRRLYMPQRSGRCLGRRVRSSWMRYIR